MAVAPRGLSLWLSAAGLLYACGEDSDPPNKCEQLESALCKRTADCVAAESAQRDVIYDQCRSALADGVVCSEPADTPEGQVDFALCLQAVREMPCDRVLEGVAMDSLLRPDSCLDFLVSGTRSAARAP